MDDHLHTCGLATAVYVTTWLGFAIQIAKTMAMCSWLAQSEVIGLGAKVVTASDGAPCRVRVTGTLKPGLVLVERVYTAVPPGRIARAPGCMPRVKVGFRVSVKGTLFAT